MARWIVTRYIFVIVIMQEVTPSQGLPLRIYKLLRYKYNVGVFDYQIIAEYSAIL